MYKAVFFDFDGVIINSEPLIRYAFSESYKMHFGIDWDYRIVYTINSEK